MLVRTPLKVLQLCCLGRGQSKRKFLPDECKSALVGNRPPIAPVIAPVIALYGILKHLGGELLDRDVAGHRLGLKADGQGVGYSNR